MYQGLPVLAETSSLAHPYHQRTIGSQGGSIWSLAANPASNLLALGCEDGTVRILSLENDALTHHRRIGKVKCRMLSLAWGPPIPKQSRKSVFATTVNDNASDTDDEDDEWNDSWLVTGCSDSSLRKWDVNTGQLMERIGLDKVRGERTLVWTVGVLGYVFDHFSWMSANNKDAKGMALSSLATQLVSSNSGIPGLAPSSRASMPMVRMCSVWLSVLSVFPRPWLGSETNIQQDGKAVYTSGVDQKTVQFSLVKTSSPDNTNSSSPRWVQTGSKRMHSHDVRALAMWPPHIPLSAPFKRAFSPDVAPILASGGLDMSLVLAPAALASSSAVKITNPLATSLEATFEDAYHRRVAYSQEGHVRVSRNAKLISSISEAGITVWRIYGEGRCKESEGEDMVEGEAGENAESPQEFTSGWEKILEMDLNVTTNIIAHEISEDGSWLAVSDLYETKLFRLVSNVRF